MKTTLKRIDENLLVRIYPPFQGEQFDVLIVPPTGGENILDRTLAKSLTRKGHQVGILQFDWPENLVTPDLGIHDRAIAGFLKGLNELLSQQKNQKKVTLIGASLGGLFSSVAFGVGLKDSKYVGLKKIGKIVLTSIGGPHPDLLVNSKQEGVVAQTQIRMKTGKYKQLEDLRQALDQAITLNLSRWTDPTANFRVLFFKSRWDSKVPYKYQNSLWEQWGRPQRRIFPMGHRHTIIWVYLTQARVIDQFLRS